MGGRVHEKENQGQAGMRGSFRFECFSGCLVGFLLAFEVHGGEPPGGGHESTGVVGAAGAGVRVIAPADTRNTDRRTK